MGAEAAVRDTETLAAPETRTPAPRTRTPLSVVPAPLPRTGRGMIVLALGVLAVALGLVLLFNITVSNRQFEVIGLRQAQAELTERNELLAQRLGYLEAPQNLAARADALGMVAPAGTAAIDLAERTVSGTATPAAEDARSATYVAPPAVVDRPVGLERREGDALPAGQIAGPAQQSVADAQREKERAERAADAEQSTSEAGSSDASDSD